MAKIILFLSAFLLRYQLDAQVVRFTVLGEDNINGQLKITRGKMPSGNDYGQTGILRLQTTSQTTIKVTGQMTVSNTCGGSRTRNFTVHLNAHPTLSGGLSSFGDVELLSLGDDCKGKFLGGGDYDRIANVSYQNIRISNIEEKMETSNESVLRVASPATQSSLQLTATSAKQTQPYQTQANNYLSQAQNTNQSAIMQQLNLNLASVNAYMAGNTQQLQQINQMQRQQQQQANQQLFNSAVSLFNTLQRNAELKQQRLAEARNSRIAEAENGSISDMKSLASSFAYGSSYSGIEKDKNKAIYWYNRAVDRGDTCSLFEIATYAYLYPEEISDATFLGNLENFCTAYVLLTDDKQLTDRCKSYGGVGGLKRSIAQSVSLVYSEIKSTLNTEQLALFKNLIADRIEYLQSTGGKEKRLAKKQLPVLQTYIKEISKKLTGLNSGEQIADSLAMEYFVRSNMKQLYKPVDNNGLKLQDENKGETAGDGDVINKHAFSIGASFRLVEQPVFAPFLQTYSPSSFKEEEDKYKAIVVVGWSTDNVASIAEYKKILNLKTGLEESGILLIGVSFDEDREVWQKTIERERLDNKWNCIIDPNRLVKYPTLYSNLLLEHASKTSVPFGLLVQEGKVLGADRNMQINK